MNRRALLKALSVIGAGTIIPFRDSLARTATGMTTMLRPFHRFSLGNLTITVLTDGHIKLSPVQPNFPNGDEASELAILRNAYRDTSAVDLGMNILLVQHEQKLIMIDTGTGGSFGPDSGWILTSIIDAGLSPDKITDIVITHAHPDHIGGLLAKDGTPVYPNAQVYISKIEHAFWMAPAQDFSRSKFQDKKLLASFTATTQATMKALANRLHFFNDGAELFGCLRLQIAPGHTPGHTLVHVYSGNETLVHLADLVHSDLISFPHPEYGFNGDSDIDLATATRRKVLTALAGKTSKVFGYHLPWPGIGHVRTSGKAFEWMPEVYAYPQG